jgi:WD40 repeat protein
VVTASDDGTVRLWDGVTGLPLTESARFAQPVLEAGFGQDGGDVLIVLETDGARLFTPTPTQPLWQSSSLPPPAPVRVADDERAALAQAHTDVLNFIDVSPDGRFVVTASGDKTACVYHRGTRKRINEPLKHDAAVNCARFSPDGRRLVTSTASRKFRVWDMRTGVPLTDWIESDVPVGSVWFSADGSTVLTDGGRAWSVATIQGKLRSWLPDLAEAVAGVRLNAAGTTEPVPAHAFPDLKAALSASSEAGPLAVRIRQFLAALGEPSGAAATGKP